MQTISDYSDYLELVGNSPALLCYFSTPSCQVCKVLKPKVLELVSEEFPEMKTAWIDIERSPLIAGQNSIFTAPTLLVYFNGKETVRKIRNFGIEELESGIRRVYEQVIRK